MGPKSRLAILVTQGNGRNGVRSKNIVFRERNSESFVHTHLKLSYGEGLWGLGATVKLQMCPQAKAQSLVST